MSPFADLVTHVVSAVVTAAPGDAFAFLADAGNVDTWTLGSMDAQNLGDGVYVGRSLYDGGSTYFKADPDPARGVVDYLVGSDPDGLVKRISARVVPGEDQGYGKGTSIVILSAWRPAGMSDARWHRLCAFHEVEILLLAKRLGAD
jgi:hypothetical protein